MKKDRPINRIRDRFLKKAIGDKRLIRRAVFSYESEKNLKGLLIEDKNGSLFSAEPNDNMITKHLLHYGEWQYNEVDNALKIFSQKVNKGQNSYFVDIGCHIGTQLITALKKYPFHYGYGFEVTKNTFEHLKRNIKLNDLENRASVYNIALGKEGKTYELFEAYQNHGANRLLENGKANGSSQPIKPVDFEGFAKKENLSLLEESGHTLYWLDTEGLELDIIESLSNVLRPQKDALVFEYNRRFYEAGQLNECLDALYKKFDNAYELRDFKAITKEEVLNTSRYIDLMFY